MSAVEVKNPGNAEELLRQGLAKHTAGQPEMAEPFYRRILQSEPNHPEALHLLGLVLLGRQQIDDAIANINAAIAINPRSAVFFNNLGQCYLDRQETAAAELCFRKALELDPIYADAGNNLAWVFAEQRRYDEARQLLERVLVQEPQHERALANLASIHFERHGFSEALGCFERIISVSPKSGMGLIGKLSCLFELHRIDEALELADAIPALDPSRRSDAMAKKGEMLEGLGRLDEARAIFDSELKRDPTNVELLYSRSCAVKADPSDSYFAELPKAVAKIGQLGGRPRAKLCYALGKIQADLGDMESAARYYAIGAASMSQLVPHKENEEERLTSAIETGCTRDFLDSQRASGNDSSRPIFILGMMRSGTTLTEQFLASHPEIFPAGELKFLPEMLENYSFPGGVTLNVTGNDRITVRTTLAERANAYLERVATLPRSGEKARFTDKYPNNFLYVGFIRAMFPNAKIIHCRRDPIDTCISNYTTLLNSNVSWSFDLGFLGRHFRRYWRLMEHWRRVLPGEFLEIRYEETVADPEGMARRLLDWCGLDWNERVLKFHETERIVRTASVTQVRQPIYSSSVGRWKKWEPYIAPLLDEIRDLEKDYWRDAAG